MYDLPSTPTPSPLAVNKNKDVFANHPSAEHPSVQSLSTYVSMSVCDISFLVSISYILRLKSLKL